MKLPPEELEKHGYRVIDQLQHQDIIPFVQKGLKLKNRYTRAYLFFNLIFLSALLLKLFLCWKAEDFSFADALSYVSYGVVMALLLIPIHEYIHVLAYRQVGASNTSYDANLRKFYFMAVADRFVANLQEFRIVALAPFVSVSSVLLCLLLFAGPWWSLSFWAMLLTHTAFCSGDFGLLAYMYANRRQGMVTYDDKQSKMSYFLIKE